jgi:hypothetical protein
MKKLIVGGLAALAIGLATAPVAGADPGYTAADMDFIAGVTALGYYDEDQDRLIKTGHVVCELLDQGANNATVQAEVVIHHQNGREQPGDGGYWPDLFTQVAAISYCPWQPAADWNI